MMHGSREPSVVILSISNSSLPNFHFAMLPGLLKYIYICVCVCGWTFVNISLYISYLLLVAASSDLQHSLESDIGIIAGNVLIFELWAKGCQPLVKLAYS